VAIMRAKMANLPVVLGSATPSMESLHNVNKSKFRKLQLTVRAGDAHPPSINIIDMRGQRMIDAISQTLLEAIETRLNKSQQVLLFLNRRGFSPGGCGRT